MNATQYYYLFADMFPGHTLAHLSQLLYADSADCVCNCVYTYIHIILYTVYMCLREGQSYVSYLFASQFSPEAHSHMWQRISMTRLWVEGEAGSHVTICYIKSGHRGMFHSYTWTLWALWNKDQTTWLSHSFTAMLSNMNA